jgi:drug/metabolite transporter (DMT)-like permease
MTGAGRNRAETRANHYPRAVLLLLAAILLFTVLDTLAKHLSAEYHVVQVLWARYAFHVAWLLPLLRGRRLLQYARTSELSIQLARGFLLLGTTGIFFTAISFIPLADAVAIEFIAPLFVVAFSIPFLGERVGARRWVAVLVGFLAALIIIRPGLGVLHPAALLLLVSSAFFALYQIATRRLTAEDHPLTTLIYTGGFGAVVMSLAVPFFWTAPTLADWGLMAAMGAVGVVSNLAVIKAFENAPASFLAPIMYAQILTATALGYAVFGDFPDRFTILGSAVIVACGLYVTYREARLERGVGARGDGGVV